MAKWTDDDILALDRKYAEQGLPLHQRPFRAAMEIMKVEIESAFYDGSDFPQIERDYARLIPEVDSSWPGMGIGLVGSVDRVRKVTLPVVFGRIALQPWEALGFKSLEEWWEWCRKDRQIAADSAYVFADLHDFRHGLDELRGASAEAATLWRMASSNLEDLGALLPSAFSVDTAIQPVCMTAELSLKALLVHEGVDASSFKGKKGHDLAGLTQRASSARPHRDDARIAAVIHTLPGYVASRYSPAGLTRLQVVRLALGVQFVAASTVRRLTNTDLAAQMEADEWPGPRAAFVC